MIFKFTDYLFCLRSALEPLYEIFISVFILSNSRIQSLHQYSLFGGMSFAYFSLVLETWFLLVLRTYLKYLSSKSNVGTPEQQFLLIAVSFFSWVQAILSMSYNLFGNWSFKLFKIIMWQLWIVSLPLAQGLMLWLVICSVASELILQCLYSLSCVATEFFAQLA